MNFLRKGESWGTESELKFIEALGTHAAHNRFTYEELLSKYLASCQLRVKWDSIDKKEVVKKVRGLIKKCKVS